MGRFSQSIQIETPHPDLSPSSEEYLEISLITCIPICEVTRRRGFRKGKLTRFQTFYVSSHENSVLVLKRTRRNCMI